MGICYNLEEYVDEDLVKAKNINEIIEIMEEKNEDFLNQKKEIKNYMKGQSEYLRVDLLKIDRFSLERKENFLNELNITIQYCLAKIKRHKEVSFLCHP